MPSVFAGVDELIDESLGITEIGTPPHYRHKASARRLGSKPPTFEGAVLIGQILSQIERNWLESQPEGKIRKASNENWRFKKQPNISKGNSSAEKRIEKAIALECDYNWVNQIPTSSGLLNATSERSCNIDLVHRVSDGRFEFIELKIDSDTPVFAAFEILKYGMVYVFSRHHASELGYDSATVLLNAKSITLCVLAPHEYYDEHELRWLEAELSKGLREFRLADFHMDFHFEQFLQSAGMAIKLIESRTRRYQ